MERADGTRPAADDQPHASPLRASDAEREAAADALKQCHLAGRLDVEEYGERWERCFAATTRADLAALFADLPHERHERAAFESPHRRSPWWPLPLLLPAALLLIALSALTGAHLVWLLWPLAIVLVVTRRHGWWGGDRRGRRDWQHTVRGSAAR